MNKRDKKFFIGAVIWAAISAWFSYVVSFYPGEYGGSHFSERSFIEGLLITGVTPLIGVWAVWLWGRGQEGG